MSSTSTAATPTRRSMVRMVQEFVRQGMAVRKAVSLVAGSYYLSPAETRLLETKINNKAAEAR